MIITTYAQAGTLRTARLKNKKRTHSSKVLKYALMDRTIIEQNTARILHIDKIPSKVIKLADSLYLQSTTTIPLKPTQEPARIHICCVLAATKLGEKFSLPPPDVRQPPIPPATYSKLLSQFRTALLGGGREPIQDRTPSAPATPRKRTPRAARSRAVDILKDELDGDAEGSDEGEDFGARLSAKGSYSDNSEGEADLSTALSDLEEVQFNTPRKRAPTGPRAGSPSPRKSPRKSGPGPTNGKIRDIAERMSLESTTTDAVIHAFEQYKDLVKNQWGLVYGLLVVISDRAEPQPGFEHERRLGRALNELAPRVAIDRDEWIGWTEKIVTGQTWIMEISKRPEPAPPLVGAAGGWGLGVEFELVRN